MKVKDSFILFCEYHLITRFSLPSIETGLYIVWSGTIAYLNIFQKHSSGSDQYNVNYTVTCQLHQIERKRIPADVNVDILFFADSFVVSAICIDCLVFYDCVHVPFYVQSVIKRGNRTLLIGTFHISSVVKCYMHVL